MTPCKALPNLCMGAECRMQSDYRMLAACCLTATLSRHLQVLMHPGTPECHKWSVHLLGESSHCKEATAMMSCHLTHRMVRHYVQGQYVATRVQAATWSRTMEGS